MASRGKQQWIYVSPMAMLVALLLLFILEKGESTAMKPQMVHRHCIHGTGEIVLQKHIVRHLFERDNLRLGARRLAQSPSLPSNPIRVQAPASPLPAPSPFSMQLASGAQLGTALYYVELDVGTPSQKTTLVADTGSDLVWVNCDRRSVDTPQVPYDSDRSSSVSYVPCFTQECAAVSPNLECIYRPNRACLYKYDYLNSASTSGPYMRETLTLNQTSGKPLAVEKIYMGCGTRTQGLTVVSAGGVLGLGRGPNSFVMQTRNLFGGVFSYCLRNYLLPPNTTSTLLFGRREKSVELQTTPIVSPENSSFYYVDIEKISVDGKDMPVPDGALGVDEAGNGGSILDSGTSLTFLHDEVYGLVIDAIRESVKYPNVTTNDPTEFELCFDVSGAGNEPKFPDIALRLRGGAVMVVGADNYMLHIEEGVRCAGFMPVSWPAPAIIGAIFQQNFLVEYDLEKSVVGLAPKQC